MTCSTVIWDTHSSAGHEVQQQAGMIAGHSKPAFNKAARLEDIDGHSNGSSDQCTIVVGARAATDGVALR